MFNGYKFFRKKPFKHQLQALKRALELDSSCALLMDPGSAKTRVAVDFAGIKTEQAGLKRVLVVAPKSVISVWQDEIDMWLPRRIQRQVVALTGTIAQCTQQLKTLAADCLTFILVNYTKVSTLRKELHRWQPGMIVADESHYIKHGTSQRSKAMHFLGPGTRWRFILTGTLVTNSPLDVFSQYKFLDSTVFGTRWTPFKNNYAVFGGYMGYQLIKYQNTEDLMEKVHSIAFRFSKDDMDLPERLPQPIRVTMLPKTRTLYKKMARDLLIELDEAGSKATAAIVLTKLLRLRQITGGFIRDETGTDIQIGSEKLDVLAELLESHVTEAGQKVVVFAVFVWEIAAIKDLCGRAGINAVVFSSEDKSVRKRFQNDPKVKVLICQIATGGIGISLTAAHTAIFYSLDYSSDHLTQACDRLHRPGQNHKVLYQFLLMDKTIDINIYDSLRKHQDFAKSITDWRRLLKV